MRTREECQRILSKIGFELGVSPKLIATRLLSVDDKQDMLNGDVDVDVLKIAVKLWRNAGYPNYSEGNTNILEKEVKKSGCISLEEINENITCLNRFSS